MRKGFVYQTPKRKRLNVLPWTIILASDVTEIIEKEKKEREEKRKSKEKGNKNEKKR